MLSSFKKFIPIKLVISDLLYKFTYKFTGCDEILRIIFVNLCCKFKQKKCFETCTKFDKKVLETQTNIWLNLKASNYRIRSVIQC